MGLDEEGSHRRIMSILDSAAEMIRESGGEVLRYAGDAILATFPSVVGAVNASVAIQQMVSTSNEGIAGEQHVQLRIGLNLGRCNRGQGRGLRRWRQRRGSLGKPSRAGRHLPSPVRWLIRFETRQMFA